MKKINYYVATSLDGYISGENGDISKFILQGAGLKNINLIWQILVQSLWVEKPMNLDLNMGSNQGSPLILIWNTTSFRNRLKLKN